MTLALRDLWGTLEHDLAGLSDDDLLRASELLIERYGNTSPGRAERQAVLDEIREGTAPAPAGETGTDNPALAAVPSPCCEPERFIGPSGIRWRHTCKGRRGEPIAEIVSEEPDGFAMVIGAPKGEVEIMADAARELRPHPAHLHSGCVQAWREGSGYVCSSCAALLHDDDCDCWDCGYFNAHTDGGDTQA